MDCYLCNQEATQRCSRCGNPYCKDHGEAPSAGSLAGQAGQVLCADCLNPVSAAPSGTVFRASLLVLLLGSVLALWLLIRPPGLPGESSGVVVPEASPAASPEPISPSPIPTPADTAEPTPEATPEPTEYTVEAGDTWFGIAGAFGVDAEELAAANDRTLSDFLNTGEVLIIPGIAPGPSPSPTPTPEPSPEVAIEYTVVAGDTWHGIAETFGVDAESLAAFNGYTLDDFINPGDVLVIPQ